MNKNEAVKGHELFQALTVEETHRLSGFTAVRKLEAGDTVFDFGQAGTHVYMLMKGAVDLKLSADPDEFGIIVTRVKPGELFGLSPLLDSPRYTTAAQCVDSTEVLSIEAKPFAELLRNNCPVAINVLNRVARIYFSRYLDLLKNLQAVVNQIHITR